ncbi:MAG: hypothetical protein IJN50_08060 [Clostridia bacterium]|nr:hypothetical protein [Clostridia bacterium]
MLKNKRIIIAIVIVAIVLTCAIIGFFLLIKNKEKREIVYINSNERRCK